MHDAEKLIATIKAVQIPQTLDLTTDELTAIRAEAREPFDLICLSFQCGFMRGQRATRLPADVTRLLTQADDHQSKVIAAFIRQLVKEG